MFEYQGLCLSKLTQEHLPQLLQLKAESWYWTHQVSLLTLEDQERWYQSLDLCNRVFIATEEDCPVGVFKVLQIDWPNRSALVGWDVFAEHRRRGVGKRLVAAGTALCFQLLNLQRLTAEILASNEASRRCALASGYRWEGCKRQAVQRCQQRFDSHIYGMLADEYLTQPPRVNYVLAAWSGHRRHMPPTSTYYLEQQVRRLRELPHALTQITIVVPHNPTEPVEFSRWLDQCPPQLGSAAVVVLRRPNVGVSYGCFSHAYAVYRKAFDYYIFMEDDYVLSQPQADQLLIEMFQAEPNCGMLVGLVSGAGDDLHGAIANGVTSSQVLEEIWQIHEELPFARDAATYDAQHQIQFTRAFLTAGRSLCDVTHRFRVEFNEMGVVHSYGSPDLPLLMAPVSHNDMPLRILILLLYHERPDLVRHALTSLLRADAHYPHWELAFIDDRSTTPGEPIAREVLGQHCHKARFYQNRLQDHPTESVVGRTMNEAIRESQADLAVILCDDDELHPEYLLRLNQFFSEHPQELCCYSHVQLYHPAWEDSRYVNNVTGPLNAWRERIVLANRVDASQVAWRTRVHQELGIWFDFPRTACLDSVFFQQLSEKVGDTPFSGFISQYKGLHPQQMIHHVSNPLGRPHDGPDLRRATPLREILMLMEQYAARNQVEAVAHLYSLAKDVYPAMEPVLRQRLATSPDTFELATG